MFNLVLQTKDIKEAKRKNGLLEIRFPHPKEKALMLKLRHAVFCLIQLVLVRLCGCYQVKIA